MQMREQIRTIIQEKIPQACIFDAHSIIEYLIQHHSDQYLLSYSNGTTEYYHSEISKAIDSFDGISIERLPERSWSLNIHKRFTTNVCWRKK
jgi:hypothetical protein